MAVSDYLQTDDLTILLAVISATVFLLNNLYKPQPLVHPILLGRQSDVGRARNPRESAVYRNYATGLLGRFPITPAKDVHILADFVRPEVDAPRTLWSTKLTNAHLQDRAAAFATGLLRTLGPRLQSPSATVLLLLNDSLEFLVADLALAAHSILSLTLASSTLLAPVLEKHTPSVVVTHAFLLPQLLELIYEGAERSREYAIVLVGEPSAQAMASVASNVKIYNFAELERQGFKVEKILSPLPKPSDVFSIAFYRTPEGEIRGAQLTHENLTAGVAALRALFPQANAGLSSLDTVASAHPLSTPYGRAIAYTAVLEGASFASVVGSEIYVKDDGAKTKVEDASALATRKYPVPSPTVLFVKPGHLVSLTNAVLSSARSASWGLFSLGWRHKLVGIAHGWVSNQSLWDRVVFDAARARVLGEMGASVREVVVSGGSLEEDIVTPARVALSVALVNATTHPLVTAPVLASHPLDLQDIPLSASPLTAKDKNQSHVKDTTQSAGKGKATTGPPSVNVEAKLMGVDDEVVEGGGDPVGALVMRGPPVALGVGLEEWARAWGAGAEGGKVGERTGGAEGEGEWVDVGLRMRVHSNGAFREV